MGDLSQIAWPLLALVIPGKTSNLPSRGRHLKLKKCILYTWKWQNSREKRVRRKVLNGHMVLKKCISSFMKKHWTRSIQERMSSWVRSRYVKFADIPLKAKRQINVPCAVHQETNSVHSNEYHQETL